MGKVGSIIAGAALLAGVVTEAIILGPAALAAIPEEFSGAMALLGLAGASLIASGTSGLLAAGPVGQGVTEQNPIAAWNIAYGQVVVGGTFVYAESNGGILSNGSNTYDKCTNRVVMLAAHPIKSIDQVRMNGKPLPLGPGGSGAESTTWTYSPASNQNQTSINTISRSGEVVTLKLNGGIAGQNGLQFNVQNVRDYTYNGIFTVTQPNPADNTTFTYLCGGADGSSSGGYIYTCEPDYKNRIHCDLTTCLGNHTSTFPELLANSSLWTEAHKNLGRASAYLAYYYDSGVFPNGDIPQSSFVISGKNDIYDPRLGDVTNPAAQVYTTNAALIIADYLSNQTWGYNLAYGTDIPLAQLISAANICDEAVPLAVGGTEPRYTINMGFDLSRGRGEVLQDMLNACAGRISIQDGQYLIFPGAWISPSLSLTIANLCGPIEYKPILTITDSCNGVKGTYTSPGNNWQPGDIPPYCEDTLHGYTADRWLAADNGVRIWKDVAFPATTSCPSAQRLAKIDLERLRREGRLTLHCNMSAYPAVALDVIEFTYPRYGWNSKTFEVLSSKLVLQSDANGGPPTLGVDLDLAETDSTVYDWFISEELTPADTPSPAINTGQIISGPQFLELGSGPSTTVVGADGIATPRIVAAWLTAPDAVLQSGGYITVEVQRVGDTLWTPVGSVTGDQTQCYVTGVVSGFDYNVQIQGWTAQGVPSGWVQAGPVNVSATSTSLVASSVTYPDGTPVAALQPAAAGADVTANQPLSYTGLSNNLIPNGNFILGNTKGWAPTLGSAGGNFNAGGIGFGYNEASQSATFNVIPGQKYRLSFTGISSTTVAQTTYHRIFYSPTYNPNTQVSADTLLFDFLASGTIADGTYHTYTYDWTCPVGIFYASLAIYNLSLTAIISYNNVAAQDYAGVDEWGADVTGANTALAIVGQGALATVNQANTVNIAAQAVNTSVSATNTVFIDVPQFGASTLLASVTIPTNGGYVKIRGTMTIFPTASVAAVVQINLRRGGLGGAVMQFLGNVAVPAQFGGYCVPIEALDIYPNFAIVQEYVITADNASTALQCDAIFMIAENAKV